MSEDVDAILDDCEDSMRKAVDAFRRDLTRIRTGRANLQILDGVRVLYYGTPTPLNQVAGLTVADARLITAKPWDRTLIPEIEKAILKADLGLTPSSDGELIRLPIPPLTGERRKELVKTVKKMGEDAKIALRAARRDANDLLKDLDGVPEDDVNRAKKDVQAKTDRYVTLVEEVGAAKEKEILEI